MMVDNERQILEDLKAVMVKHNLWIRHDYLDRCLTLNINDVQEVVGSFEEWIDANTIQDELDRMDGKPEQDKHICECGSVGWTANCDKCIPF